MWSLTKQHLAHRSVTRRHIEDKLCGDTIPTTLMKRFSELSAAQLATQQALQTRHFLPYFSIVLTQKCLIQIQANKLSSAQLNN